MSPPRPRRIIAAPTASVAPTSGPATYAQYEDQSPDTSAGPNERAGFIDAPLTGAAQRPASATYPPTPSAPIVPTFCAAEAVPRITLTSPPVTAVSIRNACQLWYPGPGRVAPRCSTLPNTASRNRHASAAPTSWAMT